MSSYTHPWTLKALLAIRELVAEGEPFTSDDVWARIEEPPHMNMKGDAIRRAKQLRIIEETGRSLHSKRTPSKGRRVLEWTGVKETSLL